MHYLISDKISLMAEVAAALLDASRKLSSDKDYGASSGSTGNVSVTSGSSWASNNEVDHNNVAMLSVV